jgi:hypothetical protein
MDAATHQRLVEYLVDGSRDRELSDWIFGLAAFGREAAFRAALAVAVPCLEIWDREVCRWGERFSSSTALARSMIAAALRDLAAGTVPDKTFHEQAAEIRYLVACAHTNADEMSGSAEACLAMDRMAAAGAAVEAALESVVWDATQATAGVPDEGERQAIIAAGPATDVWRAVRAFRFACSAGADEVRRLVTAALLEPRP